MKQEEDQLMGEDDFSALRAMILSTKADIDSLVGDS
jgi:hypothetical protein